MVMILMMTITMLMIVMHDGNKRILTTFIAGEVVVANSRVQIRVELHSLVRRRGVVLVPRRTRVVHETQLVIECRKTFVRYL
jgi:hypothetical protein